NSSTYASFAAHFSFRLPLRKLVQEIVSGDFVAFRERAIVENGVNKIFDRALSDKNSLPDMQQFRRAFADHMYAQNFFGVGFKNQLEAAGGIAANLSTRDFAEVRNAD